MMHVILPRSIYVKFIYSTVQYSTVQYSTVQYSTVQYSTVQYSTTQFLSTLKYLAMCESISGDICCILLPCRSSVDSDGNWLDRLAIFEMLKFSIKFL